MQVAGRLFAEHGYHGVGVREIARESGVNASSIFYHFGNKDSIYDEIIDYKYQAAADIIMKTIKPADSPVKKLECVIGSLFDGLFRDRTVLLLLQRDVVDVVAERHRPGFAREYANFISLTSKLLEAALERPVEEEVAFALLSLVLGYCELTAALSGSLNESALREDETQALKRRAALIAAGKKLCLT